MLAKTKSYALNGVEGYEVAIEVDLNAGLPAYDTSGLPIRLSKNQKRG